MSVFLKGIRLANYRGIGPEQTIAPFSRFNFFIGPNNSGKSILLNFLSQHSDLVESEILNPKNYNFSDKDYFNFDKSNQISISIAHIPEELLSASNVNRANGLSLLNEITVEGLIWKSFYHARYERNSCESFFDQKFRARNKDTSFAEQSGKYYSSTPATNYMDYFDEIETPTHPKIRLIPAFRTVGNAQTEFDGYNGDGVIKFLSEIERPLPHQQEKRDKFSKINKLLRAVLNKQDAQIEIAYDRSCIMVNMDGKTLELSSLGTGIEEIILIGSYCTIYDGSIFCIEEPEIHLHPRLLRQLLQYLDSETSNQYLIATHSAAAIDMPNSAVFRVSNDGTATTIENVDMKGTRRLISKELGYRASDIVQSNCVIWVEGPSDRIYVNHWIKLLAPDLIESIDYSIMFYGGRLLSHLSGEDEVDDLNDFINLKALNQNTAIIIDSDKKAAGAEINSTKMRIRDEMGTGGGFAWITQGREIENYVDPKILDTALADAHPKSFKSMHAIGQFENTLHFLDTKGEVKTSANKVRVAENAIENITELNILDLDAKMKELVIFIKSATL